jgi:hypothetical protein
MMNAQFSMLSPTADGGYVLLDKDDVSIKIVDTEGTEVYRYGGWGVDSEYSFDKPIHLNTQSGLKIFVTDAGQKNVKVFDRRLQPIAIYQIDEFVPLASKLIEGEQLLIVSKSMQEWLIIDTRFNTRHSINLSLPDNIFIDTKRSPLLTNSQIIIPVIANTKKEKLSYNYIVYSDLGVFKSWLLLPKSIQVHSKNENPFLIVSDNSIYEVNTSADSLLTKKTSSKNEKIVWVSATEYGYLKDGRLILNSIR